MEQLCLENVNAFGPFQAVILPPGRPTMETLGHSGLKENI